jgi:hypothetical protein
MEILNNINRIIVYGCSYTAGDELLDHEILGMSFSECNNFKKQFANVIKFYDHKINGNTIRELIKNDGRNINASWANQLATKFDKTCINKAVGGSSIEEHFYLILKDMSVGNILPTDLVLIGLTTPDRIFIYPTGSDKPHSNLLSNAWPWHDSKLKEHAINYFFTDFSIILNYYKTIKLLSTLDTKINIRLQPMRPTIIPGNKDFEYKSTKKELNDYVDSVWLDCQSIMLNSQIALIHDRTRRCGFGHPTVEQHAILVEQLVSA